MPKKTSKTSKNLWVPVGLAAEFDAVAGGFEADVGEVGAAALLMFLRAPKDVQLGWLGKALSYEADRQRAAMTGGGGAKLDMSTAPAMQLDRPGTRRKKKGA